MLSQAPSPAFITRSWTLCFTQGSKGTERTGPAQKTQGQDQGCDRIEHYEDKSQQAIVTKTQAFMPKRPCFSKTHRSIPIDCPS